MINKKIFHIFLIILKYIVSCILSFIISIFLYLTISNIFLFIFLFFIFYIVKLIKNKKWYDVVFVILNLASMITAIIIAGSSVQGI